MLSMVTLKRGGTKPSRMTRGADWSLAVTTDEQDKLGLLSSKNYNFSLLGATVGDEVWKRYRRLFR